MDSDEENLFGSSDEGDEDYQPITQLCAAVATQCKRHSTGHGDPVLPHVLCITEDTVPPLVARELKETLNATTVLTLVTAGKLEREFRAIEEQTTVSRIPREHVEETLELNKLCALTAYDACVVVPPLDVREIEPSHLFALLAPGGVLLFPTREGEQAITERLPLSRWQPPSLITMGNPTITAVRTLPFCVNTTAGCGEVDLANEQQLLEQCVVQLTAVERQTGKLSRQSHKNAVTALRELGLCVIPSFFAAELIARGGGAVSKDVWRATHHVPELGPDPANPRDANGQVVCKRRHALHPQRLFLNF